MQILTLLALGGLASTGVARSAQYAGKNINIPRPRFGYPAQTQRHAKRAAEPIIVQNNKTASM